MTAIVTVAGNAGKDAVHKTTQGGADLCNFSIAGTVGFGERKQTVWFDVTKWGKGSEGLSQYIRKGTKLTVVGELSTREHEGKTYLQINADYIQLQDKRENQAAGYQSNQYVGVATSDDDLDDDVPF